MKYQKLTHNDIDFIHRSINKGTSLKQIAMQLNKSKTTIYYHFRRFKGKTVNPISILSNDNELIGEFIGLFAGDGCLDKTSDYQYRTYLFFNITEKEFVHNLTDNVLIKLFGKKPMIFIEHNMFRLAYYSKNIHIFIQTYLIWDKNNRKTYSVTLKSKDHSRSFITGFIRGSLDSDGYISKDKVSFATVSKELAQDISYFLNILNFKHSVRLYKEKRVNRKDIYHITISYLDRKKFLETIKPRNRKGLDAPAGTVAASSCFEIPNA